MKRGLLFFALAVLVISLTATVHAQQATEVQETTVYTESPQPQPFEGRLKIEGYAEYINFTGDVIENSTWGGGILARYMFLEWFGAQTNVTFYADSDESELGGDLSFTNWRLTALIHTYVPDIADPLYIYGGAGIGVQFNDDVGNVEVDNAFTGNVLAGIGYDITELLNVEAELGYQFGNADLTNSTHGDASVNAFFVRLGGGIRF